MGLEILEKLDQFNMRIYPTSFFVIDAYAFQSFTTQKIAGLHVQREGITAGSCGYFYHIEGYGVVGTILLSSKDIALTSISYSVVHDVQILPPEMSDSLLELLKMTVDNFIRYMDYTIQASRDNQYIPELLSVKPTQIDIDTTMFIALSPETLGRKPKEAYDRAFEKLRSGIDRERVYHIFLKEIGIDPADKQAGAEKREAFLAAMKYRQRTRENR